MYITFGVSLSGPTTRLANLWSRPFPPHYLLPLLVSHLSLGRHLRFEIGEEGFWAISLFSAAAMQWTRHMLASYSFGSNSLHNLPLHNCLCGVGVQGHLTFINSKVTKPKLFEMKKNHKKNFISRLASPFVNKILVQWPELAEAHPNTTYMGRFLWTFCQSVIP